MNYKHIKRFRKQLKWSLRKAAEESGVSFVYIRNLETGMKKNPSVQVLNKLAKAYGVPISDLINKPERKKAL